jgi:hypothetical protein
MQLLGTTPEVVFDQRYPAEYRWLSYFERMSAQMTVPFDGRRDLGVTAFFFGPQPAWGPVPFESELVDVASLGGPLLRGLWSAWSSEVRERQPGARYYAEKLAGPIGPLLEGGLDLRVIDLLRDPRDVLASIRAFTAATGVDGFGREPGLDEAAYVQRFIDRYGSQLAAMQAVPAGVDRLQLRYEDLVADLDAVAGRLGSWLGVRLDAGAVEADVDHMTSPSPAASVGRWREDLDPSEARRIADALGPALAGFGYDLT